MNDLSEHKPNSSQINNSHSLVSTSSGYCSGRSTPNMLNRINQSNSKLYFGQAQGDNVNSTSPLKGSQSANAMYIDENIDSNQLNIETTHSLTLSKRNQLNRDVHSMDTATLSPTSQFNKQKEFNMKMNDMQKEIQYLKYELDLNVNKLQSSIQSIKTFWSPELKRERMLRKEETIKYQNLYDKYKALLNAKCLTYEQQEHADELNYLKKLVYDLELRIDTQKSILQSKDDAIKNLFLLIKNCYDPNDVAYNDELQRIFNEQQFLMDDSFDVNLNHVRYLEIQNQKLQDELKAASQYNTQTTQNQFELFKSNEKFFKEKIDALKHDLNRNVNELETYKTKYESIEIREKDLQHYLDILKETLSTKEQQIGIINSEVADLRARLRDKEAQLEKKHQQLHTYQVDKRQNDSDMCELRDQMEIKDRKLNVLYRKIENLEEQVKDKEVQMQTLKTKINFYHNNSHVDHVESVDSIANAFDKVTSSLSSKSLVKDELNINIQELKELNEKKDKEIMDYQSDILDLRDEISILKTQLIHKDSHVNSLELSLTQKNDEIEEIQESFNRSTQQQIDAYKKQIKDLQKDLHYKEAKLNDAQTELNMLKHLTTSFEKQKEEMLSKLQMQQASFDELLAKYEEQMTVNKTSADTIDSHTRHMQRIRDLEDAIRESVNITAEREYAIAKQKTKSERLETENKQLKTELQKMKIQLSEQSVIYDRLNENFTKREEQLELIENEKLKEMNDLLIAKQEALLAAISEKDATIARLEEDENQTDAIQSLYDEKDSLHQRLRELNEKRIKLVQDQISVKSANHQIKQMLVLSTTLNDEDGLYA